MFAYGRIDRACDSLTERVLTRYPEFMSLGEHY